MKQIIFYWIIFLLTVFLSFFSFITQVFNQNTFEINQRQEILLQLF